MRIGRGYRPPQDWIPAGDARPISELSARGLRTACSTPTAQFKEDNRGLRDLLEAVHQDPNALWAWVGLGLNYLRLWQAGSFQKSLECFENASRLKPDWSWGHLLKGEAKRSLLDYAGALADYDRALKLDPGLAWAVAFKARVLFQSRTDSRDLALMDRAVALAPREGWMRAWRAESLRRLGRLSQSEREFRRAMRLDPLYDQAYVWRSKLLLARGRPREALSSLKKGIALCPDFEKAYRPLVRALRALGDTPGALRALEKVAALNHRNNWLGNWRVEGVPDDDAAKAALSELDAALKRRPGAVRVLAWRGETLTQMGRLEAGLKDLDAALRLAPTLSWARAWRGECLLKLGRLEDSRADLDRAVASDPSYGRSWIWRGRLKALGKDWAGAGADFERAAAERRVEYSWLDAWCGQAKLELGLPDEALKDLDRAVLLDPHARLFYGWRAKARLKTGDIRGSREDLLRLAVSRDGLPWGEIADAEQLRRSRRFSEACASLAPIIGKHGKDHPWLFLLRYRSRREGLLPGAARDVDLAFRKDPACDWIFGLSPVPNSAPPEAAFLQDESFAQRPECASVYAYRGQAEFARGLQAEGMADLERAVSLERAGWILAWLGEAKRKAGRLEEAIRELSEAARLDPRYDNAYAWRGTALLQRGDPAGAVLDLDRAIARRPTARALLDRSRARRRMQDFPGALADLHRAVRFNAELGWEQPTPEGLKRGLDELDAAARANPRQAWFEAWRGEALLRAGRAQEALAALTSALRRDKGLAWAYAWRAEARLELGQADEAARDAATAVRRDPKYARAHAVACEAELVRANPEKAFSAAARALRLNPYSARLHVLKARAALTLARPAIARKDLQRALTLCPGYAQAESLLQDISQAASPEAQGGSLEFFVNYACNAKCPFCFNPPDASAELERGLPFGELARRMYAGYAQGYRAIKFIGGEVTIREDLPKILALARRVGFRSIQITTNGIRLADRAYAAKLVGLGADSFRFSIHGHTPALHDRLVGVPGAFEKVTAAVGHLKALGARLGINYVLNKINYEALPETCLHFFDEFGISDVIVYFLRYQGFGALPQNKELLKLEMKDAVPFVRETFRRLREEGHARFPALIHFPPCVMPELEEFMLDWTKDPAGSGQGNTARDRMTLPDGSGGLIHEVTNSGKRQIAACKACIHASRCLGVEANYLDVVGDAEFSPILPAMERASR
jgi:tetratricopeptide (TPR) repeat protein